MPRPSRCAQRVLERCGHHHCRLKRRCRPNGASVARPVVHNVKKVVVGRTTAPRLYCRVSRGMPSASVARMRKAGALRRPETTVPRLQSSSSLFNAHAVGEVFVEGDLEWGHNVVDVELTQVALRQRTLEVGLRKPLISQTPIMPSNLLKGSPSSPCSGLHLIHPPNEQGHGGEGDVFCDVHVVSVWGQLHPPTSLNSNPATLPSDAEN